jgi:hypothetical protein
MKHMKWMTAFAVLGLAPIIAGTTAAPRRPDD